MFQCLLVSENAGSKDKSVNATLCDGPFYWLVKQQYLEYSISRLVFFFFLKITASNTFPQNDRHRSCWLETQL